MQSTFTDAVLSGYPDAELIRELRRRGRLLVIEANGQYYAEMKDDESYMRHCDEGVIAIITRTLRTKLIAKFVDYKGTNPHVAIRRASIIVLLSREQAEHERHEAAQSDEAVSGMPATA